MTIENDRIGGAPKILGPCPAYREGFYDAMITAALWLGNHLELGG